MFFERHNEARATFFLKYFDVVQISNLKPEQVAKKRYLNITSLYFSKRPMFLKPDAVQ
jgi:hypothetical protein